MVTTRRPRSAVNDGETLALRTKDASATLSPSRKRKTVSAPNSALASSKKARKDAGEIALSGKAQNILEDGPEGMSATAVDEKRVVEAVSGDLSKTVEVAGDDFSVNQEHQSAEFVSTTGLEYDAPSQASQVSREVEDISTAALSAHLSAPSAGKALGHRFEEAASVITSPDPAPGFDQLATVEGNEEAATIITDTEHASLVDQPTPIAEPRNALDSPGIALKRHIIFGEENPNSIDVDMAEEQEQSFLTAEPSRPDHGSEADDNDAPEEFNWKDSAMRSRDPIGPGIRPSKKTKMKVRKLRGAAEIPTTRADIVDVPKTDTTTIGDGMMEEILGAEDVSMPTAVSLSTQLIFTKSLEGDAIVSTTSKRESSTIDHRRKWPKDIKNDTTLRALSGKTTAVNGGRIGGPSLPPKSTGSLSVHKRRHVSQRKVQYSWGGRFSFLRLVKT
jgi:hypothetical protein